MHAIWNKYPEIQSELYVVREIMEENARCRDKVIEASIKDLIQSGGKMIRPGFAVIASKFGDYKPERTRAMATVVEMFHMATLVHDDVIDDSKLRRGKETIQSKYGKEYAVYIGDYLFCICFKILASTASLQSIQIDSKAMSKICLGEVEQLNSRFQKEVSVKNYLKRISGKTAELFALSLYIGAAESDCDKKLSRLFWNIGHNIGMAFQIIDDLLDYTGTDKQLGKEAGHDLRDGIYTLPLIYALESKPADLIALLEKEELSEEDIQKIIELTHEYGGIDKARALAKKYTNKAYSFMKRLPDNKYKIMLQEITGELLDRVY